MKAAVIAAFGDVPKFQDFPEPIAGDEARVIDVLAVPLENFDRVAASGSHYSSRAAYPGFPAVVGHSGVGLMGGQRIGFMGCVPPHGAMAERTVVPKGYEAAFPTIPDGVDVALAAAMPSAILTSLIPLTFGAALQPGETVLVQGATGFAGRIAVQVAKRLGAGRVVGTGRDRASLASLPGLGADAVIDLTAPDADLEPAYRRGAEPGGYDIVLDFVWGHPTEVLLHTLVPTEVGLPSKAVRIVQIGEGAGPSITLFADMLRTSGVQLMGASAGVRAAEVGGLAQKAYEWIESGALTAEVERVPLSDVAAAWTRPVHGKRVVVMPDPTVGTAPR